jgi:hypothetical protein
MCALAQVGARGGQRERVPGQRAPTGRAAGAVRVAACAALVLGAAVAVADARRQGRRAGRS